MISPKERCTDRESRYYLVTHQKQDDETSTGFRHTSKEVSLLLRPVGTTEHTGELALKLPREPPERILHVCYNWGFLH